MHITISLIVSLCTNTSMVDVQKKMAQLEAQNPGAKITLKIDKKCTKVKEE